MPNDAEIPLPRLRPPPRFNVAPPPQPNFIVVVLPPPTMLGAPPIVTQVAMVMGDAYFVLTPGGLVPAPIKAWPSEDIVEVRSAGGELLWRREVPREEMVEGRES